MTTEKTTRLGYAPEFRAAFLEKSRALIPATTWRDVSDHEMEYPESSSVLGRLTISFDWDEITVYFGPHHQHFTVYEGDVAAGAAESAAQALAFIQELVNDRVVVRWGACGSRTFSASRPGTLLGRVWRTITPWVREAVWSGRALA
jgi:hypothetical protein